MPISVRRCCGEPMLDLTEAEDFRLGIRIWKCSICGAEHQLADDTPDPPLPPSPTSHPAGTPGKLKVLCRRAARGLALFHPQDCPLVGRIASTQTGTVAHRQEVGVRRHGRRYRVRIWLPDQQKDLELGLFDSRHEAARAADLARATLSRFGDGKADGLPSPPDGNSP